MPLEITQPLYFLISFHQ